MTDAEIRIECIKAAASTPGNPNTMDLAKAYYGFVIEGAEAPIAAVHVGPEGDTIVRASGKKAPRK